MRPNSLTHMQHITTRLPDRLSLIVLLLIITAGSLSAQDTTWFSNITQQTSLMGVKGGQVSALDINNDGYADLLLQNLSYDRSMKTRFLLNLQDPNSANPKDRIFVDKTDSMGVYANPVSGVSGRIADVWAMADVNNDGHIDIVTGTFFYYVSTFQDSGDVAEVLLNDGTGRFRLVQNNGLHELGKFPCTGFCFLDYNLDGNIDIYITVFSADHQNNIWIPGFLMKGNGNGTFTDMTVASGIDGVAEPNYGATITDWNNDGWPDIMTCPYCRTEGTLWQNNRNGTFTDVTVDAGYTSKNNMRGNVDPGIGARELCQWEALPADFDNDGDMDVAQMLVHGGLGATEGRSPLSINAGPDDGYRLTWDLKKFHRPLIPQSKTWRDTLTSSTGADSILTYKTPASTGHLGDQAGSWLDFDNDMLQDFIIGTTGYDPLNDRAYIQHQNPDHSFTDIAKETGLSTWLRAGYSNRPFDFDLDGDDDFAIIYGPLTQYVPPADRAMASQIFMVRNNIGNANNSVTVKLIAPDATNRNCIGARIYVYSGGVRQMRDIQSGVGRWGMVQPFELVFGLARNTTIDSIVVRWPKAGLPRTTVVNPPINQMVAINANGMVSSGVAIAGEQSGQMSLSPNPTSDWMTARLGPGLRGNCMLEIYSSIGQRIHRSQIAGEEYVRVPVESLPEGYYMVRVTPEKGTSINMPFIKTR